MEAPVIAIAEMESQVQERIENVKKKFDAVTGEWEDRVSWVARKGDAADVINVVARYQDLVVIRRPGDEEPRYHNSDTLDRVLLGCGRPVLVLPGTGIIERMGRRILVAWNGKRESSRAVHDAIPFLEKSEAVGIVSLDEPRDVDLPGVELAEHIARHGISVETEIRQPVKGNTADQLLNIAREYAADMLVMGAYGHSRYREIVLGGTTRDILVHAHIPVLMTH
jgi:nucleotide-binding universal stress UspA family protein